MKCSLIGSGEINNYIWLKENIENSYIISSDGGLVHCDKINVLPNLIVGDFDSVPTELLSLYKEKNVKIEKFQPEKDFTDMELALEFALQKEFKEICIYGGIGSRFDHSFGNVHLLIKLLKKNIFGKLINEKNIVMVCSSNIRIKKQMQFISIIPLTENAVVSTYGLKYPLSKSTMYFGETRGISNEFEADECEVKVFSGMVCLIQSRD